jgi:hypothetical protein
MIVIRSMRFALGRLTLIVSMAAVRLRIHSPSVVNCQRKPALNHSPVVNSPSAQYMRTGPKRSLVVNSSDDGRLDVARGGPDEAHAGTTARQYRLTIAGVEGG